MQKNVQVCVEGKVFKLNRLVKWQSCELSEPADEEIGVKPTIGTGSPSEGRVVRVS